MKIKNTALRDEIHDKKYIKLNFKLQKFKKLMQMLEYFILYFTSDLWVRCCCHYLIIIKLLILLYQTNTRKETFKEEDV